MKIMLSKNIVTHFPRVKIFFVLTNEFSYVKTKKSFKIIVNHKKYFLKKQYNNYFNKF